MRLAIVRAVQVMREPTGINLPADARQASTVRLAHLTVSGCLSVTGSIAGGTMAGNRRAPRNRRVFADCRGELRPKALCAEHHQYCGRRDTRRQHPARHC